MRVKEKNGFTLAEVLIASLIGAAVISSIGSIIVSQIRQNIGYETRRQLVEDWGRVAAFIESELFLAERVYPVDGEVTGPYILDKAGSTNSCGYSADSIRLALVLNDVSSYIIYAVDEPSEAEKKFWNGPYVLRRCGPLSTEIANLGDLSGVVKNSILIGSLPSPTALTAQRGVNTLGGATAARDVSIMLSVSRNSVEYSGRFGGQARVSPSYNLLNDEINTGSSCDLLTSTTGLLCGSGVLEFTEENCPKYSGTATNRELITSLIYNCDLSRVHQFKPSGTAEVEGSKESSREDTIYFPGKRSNYTLSDICDNNYCRVTGSGMDVVIREGEVLVFADGELRI